MIFILPFALACIFLVKNSSHATAIIVFASLVSLAVIFMQLSVQMSSHSKGAYLVINRMDSVVDFSRLKIAHKIKDIDAVVMYNTIIKPRPTSFGYKIDIITMLVGSEEYEVIACRRKSSGCNDLAMIIADFIGCTLEIIDDTRNGSC